MTTALTNIASDISYREIFEVVIHTKSVAFDWQERRG